MENTVQQNASPLRIALTATTDVGRVREVNEDGFSLCPDLAAADWSLSATDGFIDLSPAGAMIIVADGMGGAAAGEVASAIALKTIAEQFSHVGSAPVSASTFRSAIAAANEAIIRHVDTAPETAGMATTVVVAWLTATQTVVAWCGDSRCYHYRPGRGLERVSCDHSYVQHLVNDGHITEDEALTHPKSNLVTRCLGDTGAPAEPDITIADIQPGDILLICSDGLCGYCPDRDIEQIIQRYRDDLPVLQEALLQAALDTGGHDNITIAIAKIAEETTLHPSPFTTHHSKKSFFKRLFGGTRNA